MILRKYHVHLQYQTVFNAQLWPEEVRSQFCEMRFRAHKSDWDGAIWDTIQPIPEYIYFFIYVLVLGEG